MRQRGKHNHAGRNWRWGLAWALAFSLAGAGTACASPAEELDAILERQAGNASDSELESYLGWEALSRKAEERGFSAEGKLSLMDGMAELADLPADIARDGYVTAGIQADEARKEWLLSFGAGLGEESALDISVYGDAEKLALAIPQFFNGTVGIRSGSFRKQYAGSALEELLGEELPEDRDVNLVFYPEAGTLDRMSQEEALEKYLGEEWDALQDSRRVEISRTGDRSIYRASYETAALIRLYRAFFEEYFGAFVSAGLVTYGDVSSALEELESTLDEIQLAMEEEICVEYYVAGDNVTSAVCFLELDMNRSAGLTEGIQGGTDGEASEEIVAEGGHLSDIAAEEETEPQYDPMNKAAVSLTLEFTDPQDLSRGWRLLAVGWDGNWEEQFWMSLRQRRERTGTAEATSLSLVLESEGQEVYNGELYRWSFDPQTGALNFGMDLEDGDSGDSLTVKVGGSFQEAEPGESFTFLLDECAFSDGEETLGIEGLVRYAADPGTISIPQDTRMVCEMSSGSLMGLLVEIQTNAEEWAVKYGFTEEPEKEEP